MVKCHKCNYVYDPQQSFATLPSNMMVAGILQDSKLPQCPECKNVDFMGLHKEVAL